MATSLGNRVAALERASPAIFQRPDGMSGEELVELIVTTMETSPDDDWKIYLDAMAHQELTELIEELEQVSHDRKECDVN